MPENRAISSQLDSLEISVFNEIPSETSDDDRRSLLAVQRATARFYKSYSYLEIGSHLGGSIQPHLLDERCQKIFSIDPRPKQQPDDRSVGYVAHYEGNSTERMLSNLKNLGNVDITKLECHDLASWEMDPNKINPAPQLAFIDGEHTKRAVLSDFRFCRAVIHEKGAILFHDYHHVHHAITAICNELKKEKVPNVPVKLGGSVFAIFFGEEILSSDPFLANLHSTNKHFVLIFKAKKILEKYGVRHLRFFVRKILMIPPRQPKQ